LLQSSNRYLTLEVAPQEPAPTHFSQVGFAIFDLEVNGEGRVAKDTLVRGQSQFIERSRLAFRSWQFMKTGNNAVVHVNATFLYKPQLSIPESRFAFNIPLPEANEQVPSPFPLRIVDPGYPVNGLSGGAVVLQLGLDAGGSISRVDVLQPAPTLSDAALSAVHSWKFYVPPGLDPLSRTAIVVMNFERPRSEVGEALASGGLGGQAIFVNGTAPGVPIGTAGALVVDDTESLAFVYSSSHWTVPYSWITRIQYVDSLPEGDLLIITFSEAPDQAKIVAFRLARQVGLSAASVISARSEKPIDFVENPHLARQRHP
jgi:hypothetical protein